MVLLLMGRAICSLHVTTIVFAKWIRMASSQLWLELGFRDFLATMGLQLMRLSIRPKMWWWTKSAICSSQIWKTIAFAKLGQTALSQPWLAMEVSAMPVVAVPQQTEEHT